MQGKEISRFFNNNAPLSAEEIKQVFEFLLESKKESEITRRETKKYNSIKNVMIEEITGKYKFYEFFFSRVFAERGEAIKKDFEIIDRGMKENNRDLVQAGVSGLSQVVASSPFTDMEKLKALLNNAD